MSTKKAHLELVAFLQTNKDKKVSEILEQVLEMTSAKKSVSTVIKNDKGEVTYIFCYYHKQWEKVADVVYGTKASSATGLNTMCKIGTNKWTKQQSVAKKAKVDLLTKVGKGDIDPKAIPKYLEEIELARISIDTKDMPKGTKEAPKA